MYLRMYWLFHAMTEGFVTFEYLQGLICSWPHCMLLFVSMLWGFFVWLLFGNLSELLEGSQIGQSLCFHSHLYSQLYKFHVLPFEIFSEVQLQLSALKVLYLFWQVHYNLPKLRIQATIFKSQVLMKCFLLSLWLCLGWLFQACLMVQFQPNANVLLSQCVLAKCSGWRIYQMCRYSFCSSLKYVKFWHCGDLNSWLLCCSLGC